ncbi:LLM class flavin-dependent oxidoreductase [Streptomyces calidiresistens]|uniref:MsnO8 family LLM class oxidoreductase n=1 Tax=Streptomyces calidiresistens TaxID=1485586 RepID=A0A7W3T5Q3_9ACTN|nr:MsnO8 family LLM class oxidoreductase [Streptomyces calidiresistens]
MSHTGSVPPGPGAAEEREPGTPRVAPGAVRGGALGNAPVPLSLLELATVGEGVSPERALLDTVEAARVAEASGYHRLWVAEHHGLPGVASSSPAVLLAHLAAHTSRIRLGSGGVMLPNHAPLLIAEQFGTLEALAPGRIDLGLGRAPGTDGLTAAALRGTDRLREGAEDFPRQVAELVAFLDGDPPPVPGARPDARVHAVPGPVTGAVNRPPVWLLGSSGYSAELAGRLGLPFAFAHHFAARHTGPALELYRASFRPSAVLDAPYSMIAVSALAGEDETEVRRQVMTGALAMLRLRGGRPGPVPTPNEAEDHPYTALEREVVESRLAEVVHGTPDAVREGLNALVASTGADELMITTMVHGAGARLRGYALLARAYELPGAEGTLPAGAGLRAPGGVPVAPPTGG